MERNIPKREPKVFDKEMRHEVIKHPQKFVRYKEGCEIYPISQKAFERLAWDAGAVYKVGKLVTAKYDVERFLNHEETDSKKRELDIDGKGR